MHISMSRLMHKRILACVRASMHACMSTIQEIERRDSSLTLQLQSGSLLIQAKFHSHISLK